MNPPYFDSFSKGYVAIHKASLGIAGSRREYFGAHKVTTTAAALAMQPDRILEFGCGVGSNLPHLRACFPKAALFGCDVSTASLEEAKAVAPEVSFFDIAKPNDLLQWRGSFDLVFIANVFHHILPQERDAWLGQIVPVLRPQGRLAFFEHNPLNLLTRYMVSRCPFDAEAHLLSQVEATCLLRRGGLVVDETKFLYPFPFLARASRLADRLLYRLPLGFQYFIIASKNGEV
ncbi:class I SAM-dependent methyltransferase [Solidesulfovibrio sp. C21]|uniref:class I SAM-dependent methyltransferase n=1 Tax=Solidesulfovibrio sp. C21 TaxID=3398613 RepID=UPI0039FC8B24